MHNGPFGRRGPRRPPIFLLVAAAAVAGLGAIVMLLWNAVLPRIAPVPELGYGQALGLFVLCRLLFGSFGRGGPRRWPGRGEAWKGKWGSMSEEDRARFREQWQARCAAKPMDRGTGSNEP